jgi:hypothetical protein
MTSSLRVKWLASAAGKPQADAVGLGEPLLNRSPGDREGARDTLLQVVIPPGVLGIALEPLGDLGKTRVSQGTPPGYAPFAKAAPQPSTGPEPLGAWLDQGDVVDVGKRSESLLTTIVIL